MPSFPFVTSVRSLNRLQHIARVMARHGFGHIVERMNLGRYLPLRGKLRPDRVGLGDTSTASMGRRLAAVCTELGPTFVKLAQMLSTRPDLVPEDIQREFQKLQDHVPPFDHELAVAIVVEDIGAPIEQRYASFEAAPFACGSIGQVYLARTIAGEEVVVKVKRPDIDEIVRQDLVLLKWLATAAANWVPELARFRPQQIVEEFENLLAHEMDFVSEASAIARFEEAFSQDDYAVIPHVHWDLTGTRVLTLGRIAGKNIDVVLNEDNRSVDRHLLARRLVNMYLKQFFDMRHFHADPHPGNILISPPARIGLVDFGQIGMISDELAGQLVIMIVGMIYRETEVVVDVLLDLGAVKAEADPKALSRALRQLLDKYYGLPLKRMDLGTIFTEIGGVFRVHDVTLPREMVMVLKTLITIAGVALRLDPDLDLVGILKPRIKGLVAARLSPAALARSGGVSLWYLLSILKSAPAQLRTLIRRASQGKWQINIRHENLESLTNELDRSSNRLAFAIIIAAVIVGSSVVISTDTASNILGVPIQWFGIAGYLFAGVLGVSLLWAIIRSGRLS